MTIASTPVQQTYYDDTSSYIGGWATINGSATVPPDLANNVNTDRFTGTTGLNFYALGTTNGGDSSLSSSITKNANGWVPAFGRVFTSTPYPDGYIAGGSQPAAMVFNFDVTTYTGGTFDMVIAGHVLGGVRSYFHDPRNSAGDFDSSVIQTYPGNGTGYTYTAAIPTNWTACDYDAGDSASDTWVYIIYIFSDQAHSDTSLSLRWNSINDDNRFLSYNHQSEQVMGGSSRIDPQKGNNGEGNQVVYTASDFTPGPIASCAPSGMSLYHNSVYISSCAALTKDLNTWENSGTHIDRADVSRTRKTRNSVYFT